jgi:hypothetical protein
MVRADRVPAALARRRWIYGVVVASANGVLAWRRTGVDDDPVAAVLGNSRSPERIADSRHLRHLHCFGDVGLGAQTLRDQPCLVPSPQELDDPPVPALYRFRAAHGLPHHPRAIIYSVQGGLDFDTPIFKTPGMDVIVVGTTNVAAKLSARGATPTVVDVIAGGLDRRGQDLAIQRLDVSPLAFQRSLTGREETESSTRRLSRAGPSLNDLVRPHQEGLRDLQPKRLGGLDVDDQLKICSAVQRADRLASLP